MAATDLDDIAGVFNTILSDRIADQVRRDNFLLNVLDTEPASNGGACTWPVKLDGRDNAAEDDGSDMDPIADFATHNIHTTGMLGWARYRSGVHVDGLAQAAAAVNRRYAPVAGTEMIGATLMGSEIRDAVLDLSKRFGTHLYTGDPAATPAQIAGADAICTTGTFATINPATSGQSAWSSVDATDTVANLNARTLRDNLIEPFRDKAGEAPEFITCSSAMFNALADAIEDMPAHREVRQLSVSGRGQAVDLSLIKGVRYMQVEDVTIVQDRFCPANSFYAWHTAGLKINYIPPEPPENFDGVAELAQRLTGSGVAPEAVQQLFMKASGRLAPWMKTIGRLGDSDRAFIGLYCQMKVLYRHHIGRLVLTP